MIKEQKGITLIALVITIIVLLILAGVSIAMLTGDNGLLTQSKRAAQNSLVAEEKDLASTEVTAAYSSYLEKKYSEGETTEFNEWVKTNAIKNHGDKYTFSTTDATIKLKDKWMKKDGSESEVVGTIDKSRFNKLDRVRN